MGQRQRKGLKEEKRGLGRTGQKDEKWRECREIGGGGGRRREKGGGG
jgi:hypothetical protein